MADVALPPAAQVRALDAGVQHALKALDFVNLAFAHGLDGWKMFQTPNGQVLGAAGVRFAVRAGAESTALSLAVGQREVRMRPNPETGGPIMDFTPEGGGVSQTFRVAESGTLWVRVDVATAFESTAQHLSNADGGLFEVLVDDKPLAQKKLGEVKNHAVERAALEGSRVLLPGLHTLAIRVTRGLKPSLAREKNALGKVTKAVTLISYLGPVSVAWR